MITRCRFCDFHLESPLSEDILRVLAEPDLPDEDYVLWFDRLVHQYGGREVHGVKVHMGIKHPEAAYKGILPDYDYSEWEKPYAARIEQRFDSAFHGTGMSLF